MCGQGTGQGGRGQGVGHEKTGRKGLPRFMKLIWDPVEALKESFSTRQASHSSLIPLPIP
jgi:hypothetical protein